MNQPTRVEESNENRCVLYVAFELGRKEWKLAFALEARQKPRLRTIAAGDISALLKEIEHAAQKLAVAENYRVASCYEAGRDGFWLHRQLAALGVDNVVVDAGSIEVSRRFRRAKTDKLDVQGLLSRLIRYCQGERKVWSVVRVPTVEQEDGRQLSRELESLKQERTRHRNRLLGLLASQGVLQVKVRGDFVEQLSKLALWDGTALAPGMRGRLLREYERLEKVQEQIRDLEKQRQEEVTSANAAMDKVKQLVLLKGIAMTSSWLFVREFFGWRQFRNRREVASLAGLAPLPYESGESIRHDQGISKAGNRRLRTMIIEIAWTWLRFQPQSRLSLWFQDRYGPGSRRSRRVGIVALARKLLVELWRYLETGAIPEGAVLKSCV
ncbi:MAG: IS110 family transposase [Thermoanaerobaculia bacterium]